jgi:hypothetical protein|mmetsp:Transcript_32281/g.52424  ORF Transcript_32281/g.52424 Transcript_32281/m.52424 type:complete len:94 (+) Transcript_32281:734-1015(+)
MSSVAINPQALQHGNRGAREAGIGMHSHGSYTSTMVQRLMALGGQGERGGDQAMQGVAHQTPDGLQTELSTVTESRAAMKRRTKILRPSNPAQ